MLIFLPDIHDDPENISPILRFARPGVVRIPAQELIEFLKGLRIIPLRIIIVRKDEGDGIL